MHVERESGKKIKEVGDYGVLGNIKSTGYSSVKKCCYRSAIVSTATFWKNAVIDLKSRVNSSIL